MGDSCYVQPLSLSLKEALKLVNNSSCNDLSAEESQKLKEAAVALYAFATQPPDRNVSTAARTMTHLSKLYPLNRGGKKKKSPSKKK